ncbi:MAG TPA: 50S ribosomal protein L23 [Hyphomicrobiaceae bacterium MAG_BT-2024]
MLKINMYDVIISPIITEKSTVVSQDNQILFNVAKGASKVCIKQAVEELFDVKVKSVNTLVRKGKRKTFRGIRGRQKDKKKAFVTLEDGYSIDVTTGL